MFLLRERIEGGIGTIGLRRRRPIADVLSTHRFVTGLQIYNGLDANLLFEEHTTGGAIGRVGTVGAIGKVGTGGAIGKVETVGGTTGRVGTVGGVDNKRRPMEDVLSTQRFVAGLQIYNGLDANLLFEEHGTFGGGTSTFGGGTNTFGEGMLTRVLPILLVFLTHRPVFVLQI